MAGIVVNLSGTASMTTTTDTDGYYQFGSRASKLLAGDYTVKPSGSPTVPSKDVTITTRTLGQLGDVPWPVYGVDFLVAGTLFNTWAQYDVGEGAMSLAIDDLNGDSHPDLAGDGTFNPAVKYSAGDYEPFSNSLSISELDGDGHLDLAAASYGGGTVSVLLNSSNP